jgi:SH3-like domain-containing protein
LSRKILFGIAILAIVCVWAYVRMRHARLPLEIAYAGNRQVTLWRSTAQVRQAVATVSFGEPLDVLKRFQDQVNVRTSNGTVGWVAERDLLSADLWQKAKDLERKAASMPVEAHGHTRVLSNLHIAPGRDTPRIRQLSKMVPVEVYERQPMEVPAAANAKAGDEEENSGGPAETKKEDWWLIRAHTQDDVTISGWLLGRFIDLEVPPPLPDYASSTGMRILAWFELSRVNDDSGTPRPQYLVVGTHGPEGQPCDFTMLRVYTWGIQRGRYETAYVESNACGRLPVKITPAAAPSSEIFFSFQNLGGNGTEERKYFMHQTIVRRIRESGIRPRNKGR